MKKHTAVLTLVAGLAVTVAFQACGGGIHEDPGYVSDSSTLGLGAASASGLAAFQAGFYAFTKTQNCVKCHGAFQTPKFADPDVNTAYSYFVTLVDPSAPTNSIIITYAGNGHCSDTPCSDPSVRPQVTSLLQSWAAAVKASGGTGVGAKYVTDSLAIPATLPALGAAPAVLRFPLAKLGMPTVSGALFEIELNRFNTNEYRVARAKIMGNTGTITVSGIHVYVKPATATGIGLEDGDQGMAWASIQAVVNASTLPAKLPTTPLTATPMVTTTLGIAQQSTADMLTIGFDDIVDGAVLTPPPPAPAPTPTPTGTTPPTTVRFADLVSASPTLGIFANNCTSCHSGAAPAAGLDLTNYTMAKAQATTILSRMSNPNMPMPPSGMLSTDDQQIVQIWVNGGELQ